MDEQIKKQIAIIDDWRKLANSIGSKPLNDLLDGYAQSLNQISANRAREVEGSKREAALKAENDQHKAALAKYGGRIAELRKAELEAAQAKIQAELKKLEPVKPDEPKAE